MDISTLRLLWHQYGRHAGAATAAILLFTAGWQAGRTTSPYYAAHPIVFEDCRTADTSGAPGGGDAASLQALKNKVEAVAAENDALPAPHAAVAGTQTEKPSPAEIPKKTPSVDAGEPANAPFVASRNSSLFHHISCPSVGRIKEENKIFFTTAEQARGAGLMPSQCTQKLGY
ncbi:MAG: hypothetical protein COT71_02810 [Candidatus Andersenbacteria bacterium CG10_big_fil_rev_8_21_14_0_10_54_11]|uniref:Ada DNA repair metal-binding domain-containing protein n=1 Tax=Candidatus Andersenbacteria bacterium CG10_big_fil_rev_8_21_14_0_10_54_11 TaxID=1974485 RepID=A0A2M6WZ45_9BACT|nr:MAG: hypothetical protein COT71_02810 [Candidatus Andersenbacteria bacterium CG10_big_fil_rev_8_21_14_0_10_54_11]